MNFVDEFLRNSGIDADTVLAPDKRQLLWAIRAADFETVKRVVEAQLNRPWLEDENWSELDDEDGA